MPISISTIVEPLSGGAHISLRRTSMLSASTDRGVIDEIIVARQLARSGRGPLKWGATSYGPLERNRVHAADAR